MYPFIRIALWLGTLSILNRTSDRQAIGTAARGIFEHHIDLKWIEKFPDEATFVKFREFPMLDRYMAARKVVNHKNSGRVSNIDITPYQKFMDEVDAVEPIEKRLTRVWGLQKNGQARSKIEHWTGVRDLRDRARDIGSEFEDTYVQMYPILCALVHSGPTSEHGDMEWLEKQVAFSYFYAYKHAIEATIVFCDLLDIRRQILDFDAGMRQLLQWSAETMDKLPKR